ncbi:nucleotidyl transferase AbiEii/AbiGii toxin family protein [candidate division TA06 bacterium]|nr:nucleotidyl transferase AbiEii/AbiGii toxin family protein [candidate division TA06 bacterium]
MKDILEGSKQLLTESIDLLGKTVNEVIFIGGWGPYLRHIDRHPGTKDVDILFPLNYSREIIISILENFLKNNFYISAKHDFQLCRAFQIGERTYIFNVDLLHPTEGKIEKVDFIEIMDLDVTVDGIRVKPIVSINVEFGDVIHSEKLIGQVEFAGKKIKVLDGAGIVISKLSACHNKKRPRDIYDIYLSLTEPNTIGKMEKLVSINPLIKKKLDEYAEHLKNNWSDYENSLKTFGVNDPKAKELLLMGR